MKLFSRFSWHFFWVTLLFLNCRKGPTSPELDSYLWEASTPEEQGMDSGMIHAAFAEAENRGFVDGLVIIKNGRLIAETYCNGFDKNTAHNAMSVSKSFLSALTGIALREGCLDSLNQKMIAFFPEYVYPSMDPRKYDITLRHLLMMRAGIDQEQNNYFQIYKSPDWIKATIDLPLLFDPGSRMVYNTFQTHLLSAILTKASRMSTLEFAKRFLLDPLGIFVRRWEQDPQGYYFGGNAMHFTPRDMARFGFLYLHNGAVDGRQIVPDEWVKESLTDFTGHKNLSWGDLKNYNYGYLWWTGELGGYKAVLAIGHGGQFIILFPQMDMVLAATANHDVDWDTADRQERSVLDLVARFILQALKK